MSKGLRGFASDNTSGVHPRFLEAIAAANTGWAPAYGDDPWTARAAARFRELFGEDTAACFVFNGTGANIVALQSVTDRFHAVVCADGAHLDHSECGAPEALTGCKLVTVPAVEGKLVPAAVAARLRGFGDVHASQPRVLSIAQPTELGTVYSLDEIRALADLAHGHGMVLHMDGARLTNAAARLGIGLREMTRDAGVDVVSFGGTKAGLLFGEAVLVFGNKLAAKALPFLQKQSLQLASKSRFVAAQFLAFLEGAPGAAGAPGSAGQELWRTLASHANAMARVLGDGVKGAPGVRLAAPVESNAVFAWVPAPLVAELQKDFFFYGWDAPAGAPEAAAGLKLVRWMTAFDTVEADVRALAERVRGR